MAGDAPPVTLVVPPDCAGMRLDQTLARLLPDFSRSRLAEWIRQERVTVEGVPARPRQKVRGGESLVVRPAPDAATLAFLPEDIALDLLHEDTELLVINKPPGLVVHPGSGNWHGTLLNALLRHYPELAQVPRAGIVHRLDKDTSGLMVVARTLAAQTRLVRQLQARSVTREYAAVAHGRVERAGRIDAPIGRNPVNRVKMAVHPAGKPAVTHFEVVERYAQATLLHCRLETGRTHQIRVHLASIGHPLVGDLAYCRSALRQTIPFPRQALHAQKLVLQHPLTGETCTWHSPLPSDLQELLHRLNAP